MQPKHSHHHHVEAHREMSAWVRDAVIGMADGLTVPFALAAGLSGAAAASKLIVTAGLAEIAAGSIAMGLGGYLAARTDLEHYAAELERERREVIELPEREAQEVRDILHEFGLDAESANIVTNNLKRDPEKWVEFMMRFELNLEKPDSSRLLHSPLTIGIAYIIGGLLPLFPYMVTDNIGLALKISCVVTCLALLVFGGAKGYFTGTKILKAAVQTSIIGIAAAAAAFGLARLLG